MTVQQDGAAPTKRSKWARGVVILVACGGLFTAVTKWDQAEAVQRRVCVEWQPTHEAAQSSGQCMKKFQEIPLQEAQATITDFLSKVKGNPERALPLLARGYKVKPAHDEFLKDWDDVAWVERVSEVTRSSKAFNEFQITLRSYRVRPFKDSKTQAYNFWAARQIVDVRPYRIRLERQDVGRTLLTSIIAEGKLYGHSRYFPLATFTINTFGRAEPKPTSEPSNATDVRPGSSLRVLCSTPDEEWYSTYVGWFPREDVDLARSSADPLLICGDRRGT